MAVWTTGYEAIFKSLEAVGLDEFRDRFIELEQCGLRGCRAAEW